MIRIERCSSPNPSYHKCFNLLSVPVLPLETREMLLQHGHLTAGEINCVSLASCECHKEISGGSVLVNNAEALIASASAFLLISE